MSAGSRTVLKFGDCVLDLGRFELRRGGTVVEIEPLPLKALCYLVEHRNRVVPRDELEEKVWNVSISNEAIDSCIRKIRIAVGDTQPWHLIETLRKSTAYSQTRFGFRATVEPVGAEPALDDSAPMGTSSDAMPVSLPLPDKPSIAVMPFRNLSADPTEEYFVDGMVEAIITALGRIRWLFVIARNSTFTYKGQAIDAQRVGRELSVRYLLEGSIQRGGGRVRITARLINAEAGGVDLWSDHFDGSLEDVFDLQDKVARSVAGVIEPRLQAAESVRSARQRTADKTAYDLYLLAHAKAMSWAQQIPEALDLFEQSIARDPWYGPALAWAAYGHYRLLLDELSENRDADRVESADLARRALEMDGDNPEVLANAALVLAYVGEDIDTMLELVDQALSLNPSFARGWHISGIVRVWAGEPDIAIEHLEAALQLSRGISVGSTRFVIGAAHFFARRFDAAAPKLRVAIHQIPKFPEPYRILAACCAHMGLLKEARDVVGRLRALGFPLISDTSYLRNIEQRELLISGMRLAMRDEPTSHSPCPPFIG